MILRKLKEKDAQGMLEWMHDPDVTKGLQKDFANMTIENCMNFIQSAQDTAEDMHMAICNEEDEYQGTVSLKHIDYKNKNAEFAISMRSSAQGKGFASFGTKEILRIAFEELELEKIYLNVLADNSRAIRLYEKMQFKKEAVFEKHIIKETAIDLWWYRIFKQEYKDK